jgi:chromosome segregation ATPase
MTTRTTILALMGVGLLTLAAIATPVLAKPGDEQRAAADQRRDDRRAAMQEKAEHRGNVTEERCLARHNESLNESTERKCMKHGEFAEKAYKARRASHALLGAINATERQWARLNATEDRLEAKLAAGNFTGNETSESIEKRLEKIDAKQERLADRLEALKERLAKLHDKWAAVRDHVEDRRMRHHDSDDDADDASGSGSASSSESVSSSESETSSSSSSSAPA